MSRANSPQSKTIFTTKDKELLSTLEISVDKLHTEIIDSIKYLEEDLEGEIESAREAAEKKAEALVSELDDNTQNAKRNRLVKIY